MALRTSMLARAMTKPSHAGPTVVAQRSFALNQGAYNGYTNTSPFLGTAHNTFASESLPVSHLPGATCWWGGHRARRVGRGGGVGGWIAVGGSLGS